MPRKSHFLFRVFTLALLICLGAATIVQARPSSPDGSTTTIPLETGSLANAWRYLRSWGVDGQPYPPEGQEATLNDPQGIWWDETSAALYVVEGRGQQLNAVSGSPLGTLLPDYPLGRVGIDTRFNNLNNVSAAGGYLWLTEFSALMAYTPAGEAVRRFDNLPDVDCLTSAVVDTAADPWRVYISLGCGRNVVKLFHLDGDVAAGELTYVEEFSLPDGGMGSIILADLDGDPADREVYANSYNWPARVWACKRAASWDCSQIGAAELGEPRDVAVRPGDSDHLYVLDRGSPNSVWRCTLDGNCTLFISNAQVLSGHLMQQPEHLAFDTTGNLYVSDSHSQVILKFTADSAYVETLDYFGQYGTAYVTQPSYFNDPTGVALDDQGSLFILEGDGKRLTKLNAQGGIEWQFGTPGQNMQDSTLSFYGPVGQPALDANGNIYVADHYMRRVVILHPDGSYFTEFSSEGLPDAQSFHDPAGVALAPNGQLYVIDYDDYHNQEFRRVQVYTNNLGVWQYQSSIGTPAPGGTEPPGFEPGMMGQPSALAVADDLTVYIGDTFFNVVQKCTRPAASSSTWTCALFAGDPAALNGMDAFGINSPGGLALDGQGRVYVSDRWNLRVQVLDSAGAWLGRIGLGRSGLGHEQFNQPAGLAVDAWGNVLVADRANHRVSRFAPAAPDTEYVLNEGGRLHSVLARDGLLYLAAGGRLQIYSLADPLHPQFLGQTAPIMDAVNDIDLHGGYAYLASLQGDAWIVDLADPAAPQPVGRLYTWGRFTSLSITDGALFYGSDEGSSLQKFDLTDPLHPRQVNAVQLDTQVQDVLAVDGFVYVAGGGASAVVKLNAADLGEVDRFVTSGANFISLAWAGGSLLAADMNGGLYKIDPASMTMQDYLALDDAPRALSTDGTYAYINAAFNTRLSAVRLSTFQPAGSLDTSPYGHRAAFALGGLLYLPFRWEGLHTYQLDSSDPAALVFNETSRTSRLFNLGINLHSYKGTIYNIQVPSEMVIVDVRQPESPRLLKRYRHPYGAEAADIHFLTRNGRDLAYITLSGYCLDEVTCMSAELQVWDVTRPAAPRTLGSFPLQQGSNFFAVREESGQVRAYILEPGFWDPQGTAWTPGQLQVLDVTNPQAISALGSLAAFNGMPQAIGLAGNYAFVGETLCTPAEGCNNGGGLSAVDISDPQNMAVVYNEQLTNFYQPAASGTILYAGSDWGVYQLDFSDADPTNWSLANIMPFGGELIQGLALGEVNGHTYLWATGWYTYFWDVTDPHNPQPLDENELPPLWSKLEQDGPLLWLYSINSGLTGIWNAPFVEAFIPAAGGSLASGQDGVTLTFGAGALAADARLWHTPLYPGNLPQPPAGLRGVLRAYELRAYDALSDQPLVPAAPYQVQIVLDGWMLEHIDPVSLALYHWDGAAWTLVPGSTFDPLSLTLSAATAHTGVFQVLGAPQYQAYLPALLR